MSDTADPATAPTTGPATRPANVPPTGGRRRGRSTRKAAREAAVTPRLSTIRYGVEPVTVLDEDQLDRVHQASMRILQDPGIEFRDESALAAWAAAGADVDGSRVRIGEEVLMPLVSKAPERFEITGRGANTRVELGVDTVVFCPMHGAPFVRGLDGVRRPSQLEDLRNINRIVQSSPGFHMASGFACEPMDIPVPWRHLHINYSNLVDTDLPIFAMVTGHDRARDSVEMGRLIYGDEFYANNVTMMGHISGNSPLVWDSTMLEGMRVMVENGQSVLLSPFVLGGANTPADVAATAAQLNAEALACIAYAQLVTPGAPVVYGQYTVSVSMRTGAPMTGMPESSLLSALVAQLARRYRIPVRTTAAQSGAKVFDAQSGYESATAYMMSATANANLMLHAGGWDEAGLVHCLSKLVVDAEQNLMIARWARGVDFDNFDEALAAISRVGPGGHFLGDEFTLAHFEDAMFDPEILDYEAFENWEINGSRPIHERAAVRAGQILAEYQPPPLDADRLQALDDYVSRRESEISPQIS